jgi:hypothetical protein
MAEVIAGLALGALPIIIEAMKAYKTTYGTLHTMRNYSREVERLRKQYERQKQFFENECQLLLLSTMPKNAENADAMIQNLEHHMWREMSLNTSVEKLLNNNLDTCKGIVVDIREALAEVETRLKCFDTIKGQQTPVSGSNSFDNPGLTHLGREHFEHSISTSPILQGWV